MKAALEHASPVVRYGRALLPPGDGSHSCEQDSEEGPVCCICLDNFEETYVRQLICGHVVHQECFDEWCSFRKTTEAWSCPLCRQPALPGAMKDSKEAKSV